MPTHHQPPKNPPTTHTAPDGHLPAALRQLTDTVTALTAPQPRIINNQLHHTDSRYQALTRAVHTQTGPRFGGRNTTPIWTDALDLLTDITNTVRAWHHHHRTPDDTPTRPTVPHRLHTLTHRPWRPQDVETLTTYSTQLATWTYRIDNMLADTSHIYLDAACPACGTETIQHPHNGELIRRHTLQIDTQGCHCLACRTRWTPEYFTHLARVIGCNTPTGILE